MRKFQSGMDAWRYIVRNDSSRASFDSYIPIILSAAGALGILPFAVLRFLQEAWTAAAIDTVIIAGFLSLGTYVYRTHNARGAGIAVALLCIVGVLSTVYLIGPQQVYWTFPAMVALFYLLRPREAIVCVIVTILALLPELTSTHSASELATLAITVLIACAFAYGFSVVTYRQHQRLVNLAIRDPLTGAGNRRGLEDKLEDVVNHFDRTYAPSSIVLLDIDHLKKINDVHGHAVGDQLLRAITEIVNLRIRVTDSLYRIDGEEFVVLLEGADLNHAAHLAEQLRTLVDANELVRDPGVTISLGVAELRDRETAEEWLRRADQAMHRAKEMGCNAISLAA
ncbi:MAG: GGDEF domain-containing protein [Gammaproteobacteria bacterium]|nr:GGDEF domain-containing protein [Gammaproteobacteria bacterium]MBT8105763.1 GGDEF domain-containing protein [Gammaproteobacteria bacterium]NNF49002.1 GGDEF domain-containing protein [Woeseiaceae bacterium]NNK25777.1 GGDEF domain-containing protein [Woeseiaceae bacterium]NNL63018.1 GGDEF domain-containing protein [Woeseiaceae bacterium]